MINTLRFCFVMKSIRAPGGLFTRYDEKATPFPVVGVPTNNRPKTEMC